MLLFTADLNLVFSGLSNLLTSAGLYLTPLCKTAALLTAMMSVTGVSFGILDAGQWVTQCHVWD